MLRLNLTALNATLDRIFVKIVAINGTTSKVETILGFVNRTVTEIRGNMATIIVPGLGQIQTDVSGLIRTQEAWTMLQSLIIVFSLVAATGAVSSLAMLLKLRKPKG